MKNEGEVWWWVDVVAVSPKVFSWGGVWARANRVSFGFQPRPKITKLNLPGALGL